MGGSSPIEEIDAIRSKPPRARRLRSAEEERFQL
jgi:hypothetical protein